MAIEIGLRQLLLSESSITSKLNQTNPRLKGIYNDTVPQQAQPSYIVLTELRGDNLLALDGTGGLKFRDFDIDCKANTRVKAKALAKAVSDFLENYTGSAGDDTINAVLWNDETDEFEPDEQGSDGGVFVTTLDFTIQYTLA